eukprot:gene5380-9187_t
MSMMEDDVYSDERTEEDVLEENYEFDSDDAYEIGEDSEEWIGTLDSKLVSTTNSFESLSAEELINKQQLEVLNTSEVLDIPVSISGVLLRAYNWDQEKLFGEFFEDQKKVFKKSNINSTSETFHIGQKEKTYECGCCYDDFTGIDMYSLNCDHFLCKKCWKSFLTVSINNGPSCLHTKCPYPKCNNVVDESLISELVDKEIKIKFTKYLSRSFVDDNPRIKWCPAPDCGRAVYCPESTENDVLCSCGNSFCFKCNNESHAPASCDNLREWSIKEKDESETANWLTANTKVCPKCKRQIEKNGGCNHMTCTLCKYEFCWVCNDEWTAHGASTGGYYKCNKYQAEEIDKKYKNIEKDNAREAIEKYIHYFKRYANHSQSQKFEKVLRDKTEERMKELQIKNKYSSWIDVDYVQKGVDQLIECRNSLKYTYVYGYYLNEGSEKNLFEYLQEDLERTTEYLSEILEAPVESFNRDIIISTTKSAEKRLNHLLKDCRDGLTKHLDNKS